MSINNISSGITASAILKQKPLAENSKDKAAQIDTNDILESSSSKTDFLKEKDMKKAIGIGAGVGAAIGGIAGGITAYNMSWNKIKATNTVQSVSLDWKEPDMKSENLGKIPADYYSPISWWHTSGGHGYQDVYRDNPVIGPDGKPQMHDMHQTYSNYGKPVVTWENQNIEEKKLTGFSEFVHEDYHYENEYKGKDANGEPIYERRKEVDGYEHDYSPTIQSTHLGTYQTPKVRFETGVNVGLNTTLGVLAGAGIGAIAGGLAGAAIQTAINK